MFAGAISIKIHKELLLLVVECRKTADGASDRQTTARPQQFPHRRTSYVSRACVRGNLGVTGDLRRPGGLFELSLADDDEARAPGQLKVGGIWPHRAIHHQYRHRPTTLGSSPLDRRLIDRRFRHPFTRRVDKLVWVAEQSGQLGNRVPGQPRQSAGERPLAKEQPIEQRRLTGILTPDQHDSLRRDVGPDNATAFERLAQPEPPLWRRQFRDRGNLGSEVEAQLLGEEGELLDAQGLLQQPLGRRRRRADRNAKPLVQLLEHGGRTVHVQLDTLIGSTDDEHIVDDLTREPQLCSNCSRPRNKANGAILGSEQARSHRFVFGSQESQDGDAGKTWWRQQLHRRT